MTKTIIITGSVLALLIVLYSLYSFKFKDIETPKYKVIRSFEGVEIRSYPKMIVAQTPLENGSFDKSGSQGFRNIASYIFGGNQENKSIAMTSPVVMDMGNSPTMYFIMPSEYTLDRLPKPNSGKVNILEVSDKTLAVITFGGFSTDEKIAQHQKRLEEILKKNNVGMKGNFMYMGYNAPWDVVKRRNEVAIEVER